MQRYLARQLCFRQDIRKLLTDSLNQERWHEDAISPLNTSADQFWFRGLWRSCPKLSRLFHGRRSRTFASATPPPISHENFGSFLELVTNDAVRIGLNKTSGAKARSFLHAFFRTA